MGEEHEHVPSPIDPRVPSAKEAEAGVLSVLAEDQSERDRKVAALGPFCKSKKASPGRQRPVPVPYSSDSSESET